jgi:hypothetical protein
MMALLLSLFSCVFPLPTLSYCLLKKLSARELICLTKFAASFHRQRAAKRFDLSKNDAERTFWKAGAMLISVI